MILNHLNIYWGSRLLRNLYTGQEATVTAGHGTTDWFKLKAD